LVRLDENSVRSVFSNAACDARDVRDEQVITDQFDFVPEFTVEDLPPIPIVLRKAIFE